MGIYNVLMMWLTTVVRKKDTWTNGNYTSMVSGYWFILFFIVHYGFFLFIQVSIFLSVSDMSSQPFGPSGFFDLLIHVRNYLSPELQWVLLLFFASYGIIVLKDFVIPGLYKKASLSVLMFAPYARIFVQQFCVILGGMFLVFGAAKIFIVIFVAVKLFFETIIDYKKLLESSIEKIVLNSNKKAQ